MSVNRNVTTPEGRPPADTRTGCHTLPSFTPPTATDFRDSPRDVAVDATVRSPVVPEPADQGTENHARLLTAEPVGPLARR